MTATEFTSNFFHTYMKADSLNAMATEPLGGFDADFDIERLEDMILDRVNQVTNKYGVDVTRSGIAYCEYGTEIDTEGLREALEDILDDEELTTLMQQCEISR